jgi:hypothetical protein
MPSMSSPNRKTKRTARGYIAVVRQKWLGIELQAIIVYVPHTAKRRQPRKIRVKIVTAATDASITLISGLKT